MFDPLASPFCLTLPAHLPGPPNWTRHVPFAFALVEALRPATIVELGTHRGTSYLSFCQAVAELQLSSRCFAIDTWRGDEHAGGYESAVLDELREYHDPRYSAFSTLLQSDFDSAQAQFADRSVDLLHVDGLHTYEAVRHDFEHWLPKLSKQAVVLFHDIAVRERGFGVWQFWEEIGGQYDHFELNHRHGLGVLIVGSQLPARFRALELAARESAGFDTFFDVLGQRAELLESCDVLRQEAAVREGALSEQAAVVERLWTEVAQRQAQLSEKGAEVAQLREKAMAAATKAARDAKEHERVLAELRLLREERNSLAAKTERLDAYYGQLRFRLAERANNALRRVGWIQKAAKFSLLSLGRRHGTGREARA